MNENIAENMSNFVQSGHPSYGIELLNLTQC